MRLMGLSVRWKIGLPVAVVGLLMVGMVALGITRLSGLSDTVNEISHGYLPSVNYVIQADRDLFQALVAERSMIFVDTQTNEFVQLQETHAENVEQAKERLEKFAAISDDPKAQKLVKQFRNAFQRWLQTTNEVVAQRASDTRTGRSVAIDLSFGTAAEHFSAMRETLDSLQNLILESAEEARQRTDETITASRFELLVALSAGLVISLVFIIFAPTLITRPLGGLAEGIRKISRGDLYARVEVQSNDEFGRLGETFNEFAEKQQELIGEVKDAVEKLRISASDLSVVAEQTSGGVDQQQIETEQIASAMTEMASSVQEIAENAVQTAQATTDAEGQVSSGKATVEGSIEQIRALAGEVEASAKVIERLNNESSNIGGVLDVIRNIADQTNLLALNAAIEAARAGDQGRGFAVVADEVRTLARRTQQSTEEIESMISSFQSETAEAVRAMNTSRDRANETVRTGAEAGRMLDSVVDAVGIIRDMNHQVASATEEQSQVAEDISKRVTVIQTVNEETSAGARQTAQSSSELLRLGENLFKKVSHFNVIDPSAPNGSGKAKTSSIEHNSRAYAGSPRTT